MRCRECGSRLGISGNRRRNPDFYTDANGIKHPIRGSADYEDEKAGEKAKPSAPSVITPKLVQQVADEAAQDLARQPGIVGTYFRQEQAAGTPSMRHAKKPDGSYNMAFANSLAELVGAELARRGVIKPDNRVHKGIGRLSNHWRISQSWLKSKAA